MGWHVHFKRDDGRVGVRLVSDRRTAIDVARRLIEEGREMIRLLTHDGSESITVVEVMQARSIAGSICEPTSD